MSGLARLRQIGAAVLSAATAGFVAPLLPREPALQPSLEPLHRDGLQGTQPGEPAAAPSRTRVHMEPSDLRHDDVRGLVERLRLAVEATGLGVWNVDLATGAHGWSPELRQILGVPPEAPPHRDVFAALIYPDDRAWVWDRYVCAFAGHEDGNFRAEFRMLRAHDGAERWVEATGRIVLDSHGRATHAVGTLADVTERRHVFRAIAESEKRYRLLVETSPDAAYAHQDGVIVFANDQAAALFGAASPADLIGRSIFELVDPASLPIVRKRIAVLTMSGDRAVSAELTYRRLDGTPFTVEAAAAAVRLDGELVIQVAFRDVSKRKRAVAALHARKGELETVMATVPVAV